MNFLIQTERRKLKFFKKKSLNVRHEMALQTHWSKRYVTLVSLSSRHTECLNFSRIKTNTLVNIQAPETEKRKKWPS